MHTCPDCGQACYCDGDDTCMEGLDESLECEHCPCGGEFDDFEDEEVAPV